MQYASIEFPLLKKHTSLGEVSSPKIPVSIKTIKGYQTFPFLLDVGADFTLLPLHMKNLLNISIPQQTITLYGIEGYGISCLVTKAQFKIAHIEFDATCLISPAETTPFILGRMDFFSRFNVTFDNKTQKIILTPF